MIHFSRSIAVDLAEHRIRVNCVAPAHIPTAINAALDQAQIVRRLQPLQRVGDPRDVANAVLYLASDSSSFINGESVEINGGAYFA